MDAALQQCHISLPAEDFARTVLAVTVLAVTVEDGTTFGKEGYISHRADTSRARGSGGTIQNSE
jgi:hypothetical protein